MTEHLAAQHKTPHAPLSLSQALGHDMADRRIAILRRIGLGNSISQAARDVGVSYKAAWQALDTLTNLAGQPLVERAVGGAGGGGALITDAGRELLAAADAMEQARAEVLARWQGAGQGAGVAAPLVAALALRTSMRNQWPCTVLALHAQGAQLRVQLQGRDAATQGLHIYARITPESAQLLGLVPGLPCLALCKATAVQVHGGALPAAPAAQAQAGVNRWPARVVRVARGSEAGFDDEVSVQLEGGGQLLGFAAPGSGLRAGRKAWLQVAESAVVLAVAS